VAILLLIRHAVTESTGRRLSGWTPGVHLSERGREQASALVDRLAPVRIAALYSSPLERCRETAEPLAAARRMEIHETDELGEVRYGDWTGRSLAQLTRTKLWRAVQQAPSTVRFPGGETLLEVQERSVREADAIARRHRNGVVALVSHGDVIRLVLAHYAGLHVDQFQRLVVSPASVSVVAAGDGIPRVLRVNDTGGLHDLAPRPQRRGRKVGG
jgi:probable phosphoglycerate mutase